MNKLLFAALLVVFSTMLGATVFRDQVAAAAQLFDVHITNLDASGNVKVHEQGTAAVHEQGTAAVHEQGTANVHVVNVTVGVHETGTATAAGTLKIDPTANSVRAAAPDDVAGNLATVQCDVNLEPGDRGWDQSPVRGTTRFDVPAGKIMVVQQVAVNGFAPFGSGEQLSFVLNARAPNGAGMDVFLRAPPATRRRVWRTLGRRGRDALLPHGRKLLRPRSGLRVG